VENKTISLTDEIYAELVDGLKTGLDWTAFIAKHSASKGPLYNAIGRFIHDMEPKVRELSEVQAKLDDAGLKLGSLDQRIKETDKSVQTKNQDLALLEEQENTLKKQTKVLESNLEQKSAPLKRLQELEKLGFGEEKLKALRATLAEIGTKRGLKRDDAVNTFFAELKDYDAKTGFEQEIHRLETIVRTKTLEAEKWQAEADSLSRRHKDLTEAIAAVQNLGRQGVKAEQVVYWNGIASKVGGPEELQNKLEQYKSMSELLNARKEEAEDYGLRLTKAQSQLETLEKERAKIEAAIDALKAAGVKELKAMSEATEKQVKAVAASEIREAQVVGQEVRKGLNDLFAQVDALGEKAIEVGRTVGSVQEQLKKDTIARDLLTLLQNPAAAGYEDYLPLSLVLLKSISVWANINKNKFSYYVLLDKNLEEATRYLGGS